MVLKVKKTDSDYTYSGISITGTYASLTNAQYTTLWKDAQFAADLDNGLIYLSDDVREYVGSNCWEVIDDFLDFRDASGRKIHRSAITTEGYHYQLLSIEVTTADKDGFYNKDYAGTDLGYVTHKIYDASDVEITDAANEGNAVRTEVWIRPPFSYEAIGGLFSQATAPSTDIRLWVTGLPGIANIGFTTGGINLKHSGTQPYRVTDGRAPKYLAYVSGVSDANSFKLTLRHDAGVQHTFQLHLEIFKAP